MRAFTARSHVLPGLLALSPFASAIALPTYMLRPANTSISHFSPRVDPNVQLASAPNVLRRGQVKHTVDNPTNSIVPSLPEFPEGSRIYPNDILSWEDAGLGQSLHSYLHTTSHESSYVPVSDESPPLITRKEQDRGGNIGSKVEKPNLSEYGRALSRSSLPGEIQPRNPGSGRMHRLPIFAAPNGFRIVMNLDWRDFNIHDSSARKIFATAMEPFLKAVGKTMVPESGYWVGESGFEWSVWLFHAHLPTTDHSQRVAIEAMIPSYRGHLPLSQQEIMALGKASMQWARTQLNVEPSLFVVQDIRATPAQAVGSQGIRYEDLKSEHPSWIAPGYMPPTFGVQVNPKEVIICRGKDGFRIITRVSADPHFDIEQPANKIMWSQDFEALSQALDRESMSFTSSMEGLEFEALSWRFTWYLSTVFWTYYADPWVSIDLHWTPAQASFSTLDHKESQDICMRVLRSYFDKLGYMTREEARYDKVMDVGRILDMPRFQYRFGVFERAQ